MRTPRSARIKSADRASIRPSMQDQPTAMSKSLSSLALLLLLLLLGVVGLAEAQCEEEQCFLLSSDAEKTPFATFEEAELYGRCAARCTLEVSERNTTLTVFLILQ